MRLSRRRAIAALSSLSLSITGTARAESYPSKPVRVIVPTGPGGITDLIARIMCQRLTERLGQSFVINNRTGAGGIIGTDLVAHAAPDGYTLLMAYPSHVVNQSLKLHLPYDTIRDFTGITALTSVSLVLLVTPSLAANSVAELIALAKRQRITFASVGAGSLGYLGAELFCMRAGIEMVHVPYRSTPDAQSALMSGDVSVYFDTPITAVPQVLGGRLRALGVSTLKRAALLPEVPTIAEAGLPGYEVLGWNGILAPSGTPPAIIQKLNQELCAILDEPEVKKKLVDQGADPMPLAPDVFAKLIRDDVARWAEVLRTAGIQPD